MGGKNYNYHWTREGVKKGRAIEVSKEEEQNNKSKGVWNGITTLQSELPNVH